MGCNLKKGPKGVALSDELKEKLLTHVRNEPGMTVGKLAKQIGVSYKQLWNPLAGESQCSPKSHKAIVQYVQKRGL